MNLSILIPLEGNQYSRNLALCLTNSCSSHLHFPYNQFLTAHSDWILLGLWWFIFQQKRPGPRLPKGSNYATIGFKQVWLALREIRALPQAFLYFVAYFLLADGLNTTGQ
jgi:MFS-type transporter involved in bile tolerance (Atg22 family)